MDVLMPQLGETVAEGKITKWFVAAGAVVKPGDNLFEIETDKVSMEVPSIAAGTLTEIRVQEGEIAKVGVVVAVIAGEGGVVGRQPAAAPAPKAAPAKPVSAPAPVAQQQIKPSGPLDPYFEVRTPARNFGPARLASGALVTPLARRLAAEGGVDLSRLKGSGPRGRIVAQDVVAAGGTRPAALATGALAEQVKALYRGVPFEEVPLDAMRRTIAARLIEAKQTIPHFYLTADVTLDALNRLREDANAVWAGDRILRFQHSDIGVAVALDGGLITPVIRNAEAKSLSTISNEMKELATRARAKKLKPDEYQGGASAISNLGMYGVREFSAIINPPHATILAVGASRRAPVEAEDGSVKFVSQMSVTLSCDHRVVDGALGARLLAAFRAMIESPVRMLV